MEYTTTYPKGGINTMWEVMHINASAPNLKGLTLQGTTFTRDGCKVILMDECNKEMGRYTGFSGFGVPIDRYTITQKICEDINLLLALAGNDVVVTPEELLPVIKEVVSKCESRYGNRLPNEDYEVLVVFE